MADPEHLKILKKDLKAWHEWREKDPDVNPDLRMADLRGADLAGANLSGVAFLGANLSKASLAVADLSGADLSGADLDNAILNTARLNDATLPNASLFNAHASGAVLSNANLHSAVLRDADFRGADLRAADLSDADLHGANLARANLSEAKLRNANLGGANLSEAVLKSVDLRGGYLSNATLVRSNLSGANLTDCRIHGISAWDLNLEGTRQTSLVITPEGQPAITVDNLEVAQFIYLLLSSKRVRGVIDTLTSKVVLILGRFTVERKVVLDAIRDELRRRDYLPILFDFDKPSSRDLTETISTLAHMARFIIADITDPRSVPQELQAVIPHLSVPVQPILQGSSQQYGMFESFQEYPWVLDISRYETVDGLLGSIEETLIGPAEDKITELKT